MLVVMNNHLKMQYVRGMYVKPLSVPDGVVITIDPGKTNMAMFIGSPDGEMYVGLEFSGNARGTGPPMDTTLYCVEVRMFLRQYFANTEIYLVGMEEAITKASKKGNLYHKSGMVLKEIRANILNFFLEEYGLRTILINNWSWKAAILPDGYRSQNEKGSKRWLCDFFPDNPLSQYFAADMSDAYCMYLYLISQHCSSYTLMCKRKEEACNRTRKFFIYPESLSSIQSARVVVFNKKFTLTENVIYLCNRTNQVCYGKFPSDKLHLGEIYGNCVGFTDAPKGDITVIVEGSLSKEW